MTAVRLACAVLAVLLVAGCSSDEDKEPKSESSSTTKESPSEADESKSPAGDAPQGPKGSELLDNDQYSVSVGSKGWKKTLDSPLTYVVGKLGPESASFAITVESLPAEFTTEQYLKSARKALGNFVTDLNVTESTVKQIDGREYGFLDYSGTIGESPTLNFLAVINLSDTNAAVVTLAGVEDGWDKKRSKLLPYATTLVAK